MGFFMLRVITLLLVLFNVSSLAYALDEADLEASKQHIVKLGDEAIAFLGDADLTPDQQKSAFNRLFNDYFASERIGRFVLGRYAREATPEQLAKFNELFQEMLVEIYANRLAGFQGQSLDVNRAGFDENRRFVLVDSRILDPNSGNMATIQWRIIKEDIGLRIMDLTVEGISMGLSLRSEYSAIIQRQGGSIDGLLRVMQQKINDLNGATIDKRR